MRDVGYCVRSIRVDAYLRNFFAKFSRCMFQHTLNDSCGIMCHHHSLICFGISEHFMQFTAQFRLVFGWFTKKYFSMRVIPLMNGWISVLRFKYENLFLYNLPFKLFINLFGFADLIESDFSGFSFEFKIFFLLFEFFPIDFFGGRRWCRFFCFGRLRFYKFACWPISSTWLLKFTTFSIAKFGRWVSCLISWWNGKHTKKW